MIIDTHVHFYDPFRPQGVPWPRPDNELLYRRVLPADYEPIAEQIGVEGVVVVEASGWLEDNQWVLDLAEKTPMILGFVGNLDLNGDDFQSHLERFSQNRYLKGIRRGRITSADLADSTLTANLRALVSHDLSLDLLAGPEHLAAVAELANQFEGLRIVLDHSTHVPVSGDPLGRQWLDDIGALKSFPNVSCKFSGLTESASHAPRGSNELPSDPEYYREVLEALFDVFGPERLLFASNWPVVDMAAGVEGTGARHMCDAVMPFFAGLGENVVSRVTEKNARAVYRLA